MQFILRVSCALICHQNSCKVFCLLCNDTIFVIIVLMDYIVLRRIRTGLVRPQTICELSQSYFPRYISLQLLLGLHVVFSMSVSIQRYVTPSKRSGVLIHPLKVTIPKLLFRINVVSWFSRRDRQSLICTSTINMSNKCGCYNILPPLLTIRAIQRGKSKPE